MRIYSAGISHQRPCCLPYIDVIWQPTKMCVCFLFCINNFIHFRRQCGEHSGGGRRWTEMFASYWIWRICIEIWYSGFLFFLNVILIRYFKCSGCHHFTFYIQYKSSSIHFVNSINWGGGLHYKKNINWKQSVLEACSRERVTASDQISLSCSTCKKCNICRIYTKAQMIKNLS